MPRHACRLFAAAGGILALVLLIGCGGYESSIEAVKAARSLAGMTNAELAIDIGGKRSATIWEAKPAPAVEGEGVVEVMANIQRTARGGQKHEVRLRFLHDSKTGSVTLRAISMDGVIVDLASLSLSDLKMKLE